METTGPYILTLDSRVLQHLGINLYSNAAAVLSEAVANSWDADAHEVTIDISRDVIEFADDGRGMNLAEINARFLTVGYDKRATEGETSKEGRAFMGRKGIGKLALFSLSNEIEIHTRKGSEKHAFLMRTEDIKKRVAKGLNYYPKPIPFAGSTKGTRIVLRDLNRKRTISDAPLRKRIARRFAVIGRKDVRGKVFAVKINDLAVSSADREDLNAVEFLWTFGDKSEVIVPKTVQKAFSIPNVVATQPTATVKGWLGTVSEPKYLKTDDSGSMNGIIVLARGRLIQENILDKMGYSRILGSYLTGQIEADFLDDGNDEDIATSDRQRIIEDDPRYIALLSFLRGSLLQIQDQWTTLRNEARGKDAVQELPALAEWMADLPSGQRSGAQKLIGLIRGVEIEDEEDRKSLYRSGMLAYERLKLRDAEHQIATLSHLTAETLLPLLSDFSDFEGSLYRDIVRGRLEVIKNFESLVDSKQKETVLHKHLFKNLWLIDPGWERATESARTEQTLKREYKEFADGLTDEESKGRVDIRYRTNAGEHIIVELKKSERRMHLTELQDQGYKYKTALTKILRAQGEKNPQISIIFVLGKPIFEAETDPAYADKILDALRARVVNYEELIRRAQGAYADFLKRSEHRDKIDGILKKMV